MMFFDSQRIISGVNETALSSYKGYFLQPEVKFSKEFDHGVTTFIPSVGFGYKGVFLDGYTETGSSSNMTVNARSLHFGLANAQIDWVADFETASEELVTLRPYIGAEGSFLIGNNQATASLLTSTTTFDTGGDRNTLRGFVGVNFAKNINEATRVFGGAEVSYNTSKNTALSARIGISRTF